MTPARHITHRQACLRLENTPSAPTPGTRYLLAYDLCRSNSLTFGILTAFLSRIIAIFVGLTSGYKGGIVDRIMMVINDSFVVLPVLPILILINFIMRGQMGLMELAMIMALFGWAWDARLIRSQVLSLKEREFTFTSVSRHKHSAIYYRSTCPLSHQ